MFVDQVIADRPGIADVSGLSARKTADAFIAELADQIELEEQTRHVRAGDGDGGAPSRKRDRLRAAWGVSAAKAAAVEAGEA